MKRRSHLVFIVACCLILQACAAAELRFVLHGEPRTFTPYLVTDENSDAVRYLTGGVLIRMNRQTQKLEPGLAESWKVAKMGTAITFKLRSGVTFSDGTPFTADDVVYTFQQMMAPNVHSIHRRRIPLRPRRRRRKSLIAHFRDHHFSRAHLRPRRLFDQVAIMSAKVAAQRKSGARVVCRS